VAIQWKDKPRDLDLHLFSFHYKTLALVTHCCFKKKGQKLGLDKGECLFLDKDDVEVPTSSHVVHM